MLIPKISISLFLHTRDMSRREHTKSSHCKLLRFRKGSEVPKLKCITRFTTKYPKHFSAICSSVESEIHSEIIKTSRF